jgi:hypothetical protein
MHTEPELRQLLHRTIANKAARAGWQKHYPPGIIMLKHKFLMQHFCVESSKELNAEQLQTARQILATVEFGKAPDSTYATASSDQIRKIVRIGKYVIGPTYGEDWYLKQLPVYMRDLYSGCVHVEAEFDLKTRRVHELNQLTAKEAYYVIQRLEQVEFALSKRKPHSKH